MAWLDGWIYKKQINLTGQAGAGTNYQVKLLVGESSGAAGANFHCNEYAVSFPSAKDTSGDLRFTDDDGSTLLSFYVESVSGNTPNRIATVFVKVADSLEGNISIYCYINGATANVSSGANTFLFFDDFNRADSNLANANWTEYADGLWTVLSNEVDRPDVTDTVNEDHYALATSLGVVTNVAIRCSMKVTSFTGTDQRLGIVARSNEGLGSTQRGYCLVWRTDIRDLYILNSHIAWGTKATKAGHALNEYWRLELAVAGNAEKGKAWEIGVDAEPANYDCSETFNTQANGYVGLFTAKNGTTAAGKYDDFCVRKYIATEPSFGSSGDWATGIQSYSYTGVGGGIKGGAGLWVRGGAYSGDGGGIKGGVSIFERGTVFSATKGGVISGIGVPPKVGGRGMFRKPIL